MNASSPGNPLHPSPWFGNFVGSYRVNNPRVIVHFIPDDDNVLAGRGVPKLAWPLGACAVGGRDRIIKENLVHLIRSQAMLLYVLHVSAGLIVPDNCRVHS